MQNLPARTWLSWTCVGLLVVLCVLLAFLQNRWITQFSLAEEGRLHAELTAKLNRLAREFNGEIAGTAAGLQPSEAELQQQGREEAYARQYLAWRESHPRLFSRIALVVPRGDASLQISNLDMETGIFSPGDWPLGWEAIEDQLSARASGRFAIPIRSSTVIEMPRFRNLGPGPGRGAPPRPAETEWLLAEVNLDYVRTTMLPQLLRAYLGSGSKLDYQVEVVAGDDPSNVIFRSDTNKQKRIARDQDASVGLFDINDGPFRPGRIGPPPGPRMPPPDGGRGPGMPPPPNSANGRWILLARHEAGSLEAVVSRARWHNVEVSLGILGLILATAIALLRFSRRAQQLAQAQVDFVAGVSHELKTPLTVIRTAAFNLRDDLARKPEQVERYAQLIQEQTKRLASLVDQILRFASAEAGHVIQTREPISPGALIDEALRASRASAANPDLVVEEEIATDLPLILADEQAMRHALQNLIDNALKHGTEGSNWIGVYASAAQDDKASAVEIRIVDRGPGIPREEQAHIFDPFFRGRHALKNQIHGAGLGLNLVKKIVEAHGGSLSVVSDPFERTEFIVKIPAAPAERQHEFAHSVS